MATRTLRTALVVLTATAALTLPPVTRAADVGHTEDATYGTMFVDFIVARPLGLCATVVGAAAWVVTLPFSALGGNVDEATQTLVVKPARYTFVRPLGEL
ncbi:MAG: multidrug transporter [Gammaproteobacteria bacterium]|nr:multidrug transporter [Gammaproteobacteria bacterium]